MTRTTIYSIAAAGALACLTIVPDARAAWYVNDVQARKSLASIDSEIKSINQYYKDHGQRGTPSVRHFSNYTWPTGQRLPQVDEGFGLQVSCGNNPALTAASIRARLQQGFNVAANAKHEEIQAVQMEICGAMRVLTNIRYNESVQLVSETLPAIKSRYENEVLKGVTQHGGRGFDNAGSNQVSLQAAQLEFDMAIATFRERQSQYEQYVALLGNYNDYLGRQMVNGNGRGAGDAGGGSGIFDRLVNSMVSGSIIQAALKLGN
ncbi:MAG: hypothetical protein ACI4NW_04265 [Stenotrophomonas sp.]